MNTAQTMKRNEHWIKTLNVLSTVITRADATAAAASSCRKSCRKEDWKKAEISNVTPMSYGKKNNFPGSFSKK